MENQLDLAYLREFLSILKEAGCATFEGEAFKVSFAGEEDEEETEMVSTDVRGFAAPATDDSDDLDSMHQRAFGGPLPTLKPKKS